MSNKSGEKKRSKGRIITGICGGALGLLSLALPWIRFSGSVYRYEVIAKELTLIEIIDWLSEIGNDPTPVLLIILLAIAGSVIAFASAWGGVIQLLSWVLFSYGVTFELGREMIFGISGVVGISYAFQVGLFCAVIASIITLLGFAFRS